MIQDQSAKVIIIDDFHPFFIESLVKSGIDCVYEPQIEINNLIHILKPYSIVAVRSKINFDRETIDQLPDLKCIARGGAGMDNIDEAYALSKGITLLNAPEGNRDAVAEHTIGLLLSMSKNIVRSNNEVADFKWRREENRGWEIGGKTIGLFGFGNTGSSVAKKLSGFNCRVMAYDKYLSETKSPYAQLVSLDYLLKESDVISFHIPLTNETKWIVNRDLLEQMKPGIVLINTSRGKILRMKDVLDGIKSGKVKSLATDVLEDENVEKFDAFQRSELSSLMQDNQVIITPHIAGWSHESYYKIAQVLSEKIIRYTMKVKNNRMKVD